MHVHVVDEPKPEVAPRLLQPLRYGFELTFGESPDPACNCLVDGRPTAARLDACPNLESLVIPFAGLPGKARELMEGRSATVYNLHHNAAPTAEKAIELALACIKGTVRHDRQMRAGDWRARTQGPDAGLMDGGQALILGYGAIGRKIGQVLLALGMKVDAIKRVARSAFDGDVSLYAPSGLESRLPKCDLFVIACPLTPETQGLIGASELALMKPTACLVNIARGPIVEEQALFEALSQGRLGSAGLDVWWKYPERGGSEGPGGECDFASLDNVVLSPHIGGNTSESERLRMEHLADLLQRIKENKAHANRVDLSRGY